MNEPGVIGNLLRGAIALGFMMLAAGIATRLCGRRASWIAAAGALLLAFLLLLVGVAPRPQGSGLLYALEWGMFGAALYATGKALRGDPSPSDGAPDPEALLQFWFGDEVQTAEAIAARSALWFGSNERFDEEIREAFHDWPDRALAGEFSDWESDPRGALALVMTLDQLPRNLYRLGPRAFAFDGRALEIALRALESGFDGKLDPIEAAFLYLPLEHAEDAEIQERSVACFVRLRQRAPAHLVERLTEYCAYAERHRDVIARFGRFPHRNAILDRQSTAEEIAWLDDGGDRFGG
jgi:uncharacterized protein (DUF924 family)